MNGFICSVSQQAAVCYSVIRLGDSDVRAFPLGLWWFFHHQSKGRNLLSECMREVQELCSHIRVRWFIQRGAFEVNLAPQAGFYHQDKATPETANLRRQTSSQAVPVDHRTLATNCRANLGKLYMLAFEVTFLLCPFNRHRFWKP